MAMKTPIEKYRAALKRELLHIRSSITGQRTWRPEDVEDIIRAQTNKIIRHVMKYNTPEEYAELLSM